MKDAKNRRRDRRQVVINIGDRVRLRAASIRTRIRPAGSTGTVYDLKDGIVFVRWDEYLFEHRDDDIVASQLEKAS